MVVLLGSTPLPTIVNKFFATDLQRILTPSFITVDMFSLVGTYVFHVVLVHKDDDLLDQKISAMIPFMPIRLYKINDMG